MSAITLPRPRTLPDPTRWLSRLWSLRLTNPTWHALLASALRAEAFPADRGVALVLPGTSDGAPAAVLHLLDRDADGPYRAASAPYDVNGPWGAQVSALRSARVAGRNVTGVAATFDVVARQYERSGDISAAWDLRGLLDDLHARLHFVRPSGGVWEDDRLRKAFWARRRQVSAVVGTFLSWNSKDTLDALQDVRALGAAYVDAGTSAHRWCGLDPTFGADVPLKVALLADPELPRSIGRAWDRDPVAFRAAVAAGRSPLEGEDLMVGAAPYVVTPDDGSGFLGVDAEFAPRVTHNRIPMRLSDLRAVGDPAGPDDLVLDARQLRGLPLDWWPGDGDAWLALRGCLPVVRWGRSIGAEAHAARFVNSGGDWPAYARRLAAATGGVGAERAVRDVRDVVHALSFQLVAPVMAATSAVDPAAGSSDHLAAAILTSGRSALRILETARAWHGRAGSTAAVVAALPRTEEVAAAERARGTWPAGLPDWSADLDVVVLSSARQLVDEGSPDEDVAGARGLSHCVGGYSNSCRTGGLRIASVRRRLPGGGYVRLSTAQLRFKGDDVLVLQHRGERNGAPPAAAVTALRDYVDLVRTGALPVDRDGLRPLPWVDGAGGPGHETWDVGRPGSYEAVRDAWAPLLPRALRTMDLVTLSATLDAAVRDRADRGWSERTWMPTPFVVPVGRASARRALGTGHAR